VSVERKLHDSNKARDQVLIASTSRRQAIAWRREVDANRLGLLIDLDKTLRGDTVAKHLSLYRVCVRMQLCRIHAWAKISE